MRAGVSDQAWPARYEFRVDSVLDGQWADWFGGLRVENDGSQTVIVGLLADQSVTHGNDRLVYTLAGWAWYAFRAATSRPSSAAIGGPSSANTPDITPAAGQHERPGQGVHRVGLLAVGSQRRPPAARRSRSCCR
jgi:hypothetical protein